MKRVGIREVAEAAGVSVTTVSHALNGRGTVAFETRERVEAAAKRLGYAPNQIASSLRRNRTKVIGFVSDEIVTTPYAGRVILGAQEAARERDLMLMLVNSAGDPETERRQIETLESYRVDGFLYATMYHRVVDRPAALAGRDVVFVDAETASEGLDHCVVPDEDGIGALATEHLIGAGHRALGVITVSEDTAAKVGRLAGIARAVTAAGIAQPPIEFGASTAMGGREAALRILTRPERPTAIVCFNDQMAMGAYQAAAELGLRVPDDLSIIGVDDLTIVAEALRPGLTTVALPHQEMGRWALERIVAVLDGTAPPRAVTRLECRLISRDSVAPPAR